MENTKISKHVTKKHQKECEKCTQTFSRSYLSHHVNSVHKEEHPFRVTRSGDFYPNSGYFWEEMAIFFWLYLAYLGSSWHFKILLGHFWLILIFWLFLKMFIWSLCFKCSRSECSKTFSSKQMMRMHIATVHEGHKPFNCGKCRNEDTVHTKRQFECSKCSKTFKDRKDMNTHMLTVHEGMPWADVWQTSSLIYLGFYKNVLEKDRTSNKSNLHWSDFKPT